MSKFASQKNDVKSLNLDASSRKWCYKCEGIGHIQLDCPNRKAFTILEAPSEDEVEEEQSDDDLEEIEQYGDDGEIFFIRRSLILDVGKEDS